MGSMLDPRRQTWCLCFKKNETLDANTAIFNQHARRYPTTERFFFLLDRVRIPNIVNDSCQKHYSIHTQDGFLAGVKIHHYFIRCETMLESL